MSNTTKLKFINNNSASYCEEGQALPFRMILSERKGDEIHALHNWIKCRDFVAEALFSELVEDPKSIYSFGWANNYKDKPLLSQDFLYMAVKGNLASLKKNIYLLQDFESENGMAATELLATDDKEVMVMESCRGWRISPTMLNLYTLITKCLMFEKLPEGAESLNDFIKNLTESKESSYNREKAYWQTILKPYGWQGVDHLLESRNTLFDIDWMKYKDTSVNALHHGHGPVAFFTAVGWVKGGDTNPGCCEVIKPSVMQFVKEVAA